MSSELRMEQVAAGALALVAGAAASLGPGGIPLILITGGAAFLLSSFGGSGSSDKPASDKDLKEAKQEILHAITDEAVADATAKILGSYSWYAGYVRLARSGAPLSERDLHQLDQQIADCLGPNSELAQGLNRLGPGLTYDDDNSKYALPALMLGAGLLIDVHLLNLARDAETGGTVTGTEWKDVADLARDWFQRIERGERFASQLISQEIFEAKPKTSEDRDKLYSALCRRHLGYDPADSHAAKPRDVMGRLQVIEESARKRAEFGGPFVLGARGHGRAHAFTVDARAGLRICWLEDFVENPTWRWDHIESPDEATGSLNAILGFPVGAYWEAVLCTFGEGRILCCWWNEQMKTWDTKVLQPPSSGMGAVVATFPQIGDKPRFFTVGGGTPSLLDGSWDDARQGWVWRNVGAHPASPLLRVDAALSVGPGEVHVFAVGGNSSGAEVIRCAISDGVTTWTNLGKPPTTQLRRAMGAMVVEPDDVSVFYTGGDLKLWVGHSRAGVWQWEDLGTPADVALHPAGTLVSQTGTKELFALDSQGNLRACWFANHWQWGSLGRPPTALLSTALGASTGGGERNIFATASDGHLWRCHAAYKDGSPWAWQDLGPLA